jgi:hypothetical protein
MSVGISRLRVRFRNIAQLDRMTGLGVFSL